MNIYDAIMKAADQIEEAPASFNFMSTRIPDRCGSPGCALGWIGLFAGRPKGVQWWSFAAVATHVLGLPDSTDFYHRMDDLTPFVRRLTGESWQWRDNAKDCARNLRLYANKYHAVDPVEIDDTKIEPAKPVITGIPKTVRAIFTEVA